MLREFEDNEGSYTIRNKANAGYVDGFLSRELRDVHPGGIERKKDLRSSHGTPEGLAAPDQPQQPRSALRQPPHKSVRFDDLVEVMLCDQHIEAVGKITMNDLQQWGHKPWGPNGQSDDDLSHSTEPDPGHPSQWVDRLKRLM